MWEISSYFIFICFTSPLLTSLARLLVSQPGLSDVIRGELRTLQTEKQRTPQLSLIVQSESDEKSGEPPPHTEPSGVLLDLQTGRKSALILLRGVVTAY